MGSPPIPLATRSGTTATLRFLEPVTCNQQDEPA